MAAARMGIRIIRLWIEGRGSWSMGVDRVAGVDCGRAALSTRPVETDRHWWGMV